MHQTYTKDAPVDMEENISLSGPVKMTYLQSLRLYTGTFTKEPVMKLFMRPIVLLLLPPVLWAALVEAVTIGFYVAITSNIAVAFAEAYQFKNWQTGLCFFSSVIGALIAIVFGGVISDKVADFFTNRNGGIREPEMRIPAIVISLVLAPGALVLYGVSIEQGLPWIAPTVAIGMCKLPPCQCYIMLIYR